MNPRDGALTLCGSLSHHPSGLGAAMHTAGYRALGLPWSYVPFGVRDLPGALHGMRALGIRGFGVSMPFKLEVMALLDKLDPLAARIGAVNTVVNDDGVLTGHNTDAFGAAEALAEALPLRDARVLVLGTGGAARAVAYGLIDRGARVFLTGRTDAHVRALAAALGCPAVANEKLTADLALDAVVHCTPVGMEDRPGVGVPDALLGRGVVVMDIVYKPVNTALIQRASEAGLRTVHGGRMLLHQAFRQFELYTEKPAPRAEMEAALGRHLAGPNG